MALRPEDPLPHGGSGSLCAFLDVNGVELKRMRGRRRTATLRRGAHAVEALMPPLSARAAAMNII